MRRLGRVIPGRKPCPPRLGPRRASRRRLRLPCFWLPQENYYKPPAQDACLPCDCFPHGSHSRTCDMDTGQCACKPGVVGRQCNRCDNPFAEVTMLGCEGARCPLTPPHLVTPGDAGHSAYRRPSRMCVGSCVCAYRSVPVCPLHTPGLGDPGSLVSGLFSTS